MSEPEHPLVARFLAAKADYEAARDALEQYRAELARLLGTRTASRFAFGEKTAAIRAVLPATQREIKDATGLPAGTISSICAVMIKRGQLVREGGTPDAAGRFRGATYRLAEQP